MIRKGPEGVKLGFRQSLPYAGVLLPLFACLAVSVPLPALSAQEQPRPSIQAGQDGPVSFNFDQVDIGTFIKVVGEMTGKRFVMGEGVKGKIMVVSPPVDRKEVFPLFMRVLESNGYALVQENDIDRIVAVPKRDTESAPVIGPDEKTPQSGFITKILRLTNVAAGEVRKALESKVGGGKTGSIASFDEANLIILTETAENVRRFEKIIAEIDKPGQSRFTEIVQLKYVAAEEIANQLNVAMAESETRADKLKNSLPSVPGSVQSGSRRSVVVVPSPHANSLILVGNLSQIEELKKILKQMDVDSPSSRVSRLNAIFLKYIAAEDAAKSINSLLMKSAGLLTGPQGQITGAGKMRIAIEANLANNALLVDASPTDFEAMKQLIAQLDRPPEQVHISVLIAEISATTNYTLGVELAAVDMPGKIGDTVVQGGTRLSDNSAESLLNTVQQGIFPRGLSVGLAHGVGLDAAGNVSAAHPAAVNIDALKKIGKVNIRSTTSLEAQNNKEATVNIVNQIPILKSTVSAGTGTARDTIQNIDRMDVGIKLKLTPHIIPGESVQMVLAPSIETIIDPGPSTAQFTPTIAKREVSTTVTVGDGRTIVIAGLTREDATKVEKKIPLLGDIPLLGFLFRRTEESSEKTDMLIFVTPKIVSDSSAASTLLNDLQQRTGIKANETR